MVVESALTVPSPVVAAIPPSAPGLLAGSALSSAVSVTLAWMFVTVGVAAVLVVAIPQPVRNLRDAAALEPDIAFAVGFIALFGLLICSVLPLFVGTSLGHATLITIGQVVGLPGVIASAALFVVGGCVGAMAVGDRLVDRIGSDSPSLWWSLVLGAIVLGVSQLVPVLGTIVTIVAATVGSGAIVSAGYEIHRGKPPLVSSTGDADRTSTDRSTTRTGRDERERRVSSEPRPDESGSRTVPPASDAPRTRRRNDRPGDADRRFECAARTGETDDLPDGNADSDEQVTDDGTRDEDERGTDTS